MVRKYDAVVLGGGFYGAAIAIFLKKHFKSVLIVEKEDDILKRASFTNQARIHNGYHYPRSFNTAFRSHSNYSVFLKDYKESVCSKFKMLYAISRKNSKVNSRQFESFCHRVGSPLEPAGLVYKKLFNPAEIEAVYEVEETAFDCLKLREILKKQISDSEVELKLNSEAIGLSRKKNNEILVKIGNQEPVLSKYVFCCLYSGLSKFLIKSGLPMINLVYELAEIILIEQPRELKNLGVTVMDGQFFSAMPFPALKLHSFSHVAYTPHFEWKNKLPENVSMEKSNFEYMLKDAARYLPVILKAKYVRSLFDIKTLLPKNKNDDGRPILFRKNHGGIKNFFIVLGGKIDNIYDVLDSINDAGIF